MNFCNTSSSKLSITCTKFLFMASIPQKCFNILIKLRKIPFTFVDVTFFIKIFDFWIKAWWRLLSKINGRALHQQFTSNILFRRLPFIRFSILFYPTWRNRGEYCWRILNIYQFEKNELLASKRKAVLFLSSDCVKNFFRRRNLAPYSGIDCVFGQYWR